MNVSLVDDAIKLVINSFKSYENEIVHTSNEENNSIYTINDKSGNQKLRISFPTSLEKIKDKDKINVVSAKPELSELSELSDLKDLILLVLKKIIGNNSNIYNLNNIKIDIHNYHLRSKNHVEEHERLHSKYLKYKNKYLKLKNSIRLDYI